MTTTTTSMLSVLTPTRISFDFHSDNPLAEVGEVLDISGVKPLSITFNPTTLYDNVTIEFANRDDAMRFSEVYVGSEDPSDIQEYVV